MIETLRPLLRPDAERFAQIQQDVSHGQLPYGLLADISNKPYALAFIAVAAGCLPVYPSDRNTARFEREAAAAALDGPAGVDASAFYLLSHAPDQLPRVFESLGAVQAIDAVFDDLRRTSEYLEQVTSGTLWWDIERDVPLRSEVDPDAIAKAQDRSRWMLEAADRCSRA